MGRRSKLRPVYALFGWKNVAEIVMAKARFCSLLESARLDYVSCEVTLQSTLLVGKRMWRRLISAPCRVSLRSCQADRRFERTLNPLSG